MVKRKVIIDTDCGSDDAVAIAMALNDPGVEILFFTTVCGNVSAEQEAINTLITIEQANTYEPPVYIGCRKPLLRDLVFAYETHGQDGMGDIGLKVNRLKVAEGNGVLKMLEALNEAEEGEIEIIALGPLTNIAVAIMLDPDAMRKVKKIYSMGSAGLGFGNVSPVAEFNIWQDAEAAKITLDFGIPLMFIGWDACLDEAMLNKDDIERIRNCSDLGRFAIECNRQLIELNTERFGEPVLDMADPAAMAAVLYPECIKECDAYYCDVDISQGISYGAVLVDKYHFSGKEPNAEICSALHGDKFKDYLYRMLCNNG